MWSVDRLAAVFAYLAVVLRAAILIFQSLFFGGVIFLCLALRRSTDSFSLAESDTARTKCLRLLRASAIFLAAAHACCLLINCRALIRDGLSIADLMGANFTLAAFIGISAALLAVPCSLALRRRLWPLLLLSFVALGSTVMTNHAFARMDGRIALILFITLHLAAAGAWIGGLPYLHVAVSAAPPEVGWIYAKRFSSIAFTSVLVIGISGLAASFKYVDRLNAIYGTSYGVMLAAKALFFLALITLGAVNKESISRLCPAQLPARLKRCVEAEFVIGITVFLTAASLTSQPPAIDLRNDRVSLSAVWARMRPTWPRLKTPELRDISPATRHLAQLSGRTEAAINANIQPANVISPNTPADIAWSEYNHNWIGLMLVVMGLLALLSRTKRLSVTCHWPLIFLAIAIFIFMRADPENWPLGPNGFWESFDQVEVLQHRAAAVMVVAFAVFEWRVQRNKTRFAFAPLVFPAVCVIGGALLLTHTHALQNSQEQVLAELSHTPLAILAVVAGCTRWLELRLPRGETRLPAHIWPICFMLIGALLLNYKEG